MNYSDEELKGMTKGIYFDKHKGDLNRAINGMKKSLAPLNEKLKPLNMMIYIDSGMTWINEHTADDRSGHSIYINDEHIEKLMSMSDKQLRKELKEL